MTDRLLIIFVKNPELGKVKSRLAATIGAQEALRVYNKLLDHTIAITKNLPVTKVVYYSEFIDTDDKWDGTLFKKQMQSKGDLGARMADAFQWGFHNGYKQVCIIGSDCFELTPETIMQTFRSLENHQVVIGPAEDGGYYLLGMNQFFERLFKNKRWSTDSVMADTVSDLKELGVDFSRLEMLKDVDIEQDLDGINYFE